MKKFILILVSALAFNAFAEDVSFKLGPIATQSIMKKAEKAEVVSNAMGGVEMLSGTIDCQLKMSHDRKTIESQICTVTAQKVE